MEQNLSLWVYLKHLLWSCSLVCNLILECLLIVCYVCGKWGIVGMLNASDILHTVLLGDILRCSVAFLMLHLLGRHWITILKMLVWTVLCQWCLNELQCTSVWNVLGHSHLPGGWICCFIFWLSAVLQNLCLKFCQKQHEEFIDIYN